MKVPAHRLLVCILLLAPAGFAPPAAHSRSSLEHAAARLFEPDETLNSLGLKPLPPIVDPGTGLFYDRLRVDFADGIVFQEARYDTTARGLVTLRAVPFSRYLEAQWGRGVRDAWRSLVVRSFNRRSTRASEDEGLLPDLQLPVDIPKPLARVIGRGGGLKVRGSNRISFGGSTTFVDPELPSETRRTSRFPSLEMDQVLRVNVEGTVGEKIHVFVDHDSEREFQTKNQVRVRYEGDEDEIIQEIELGDTRLSLPGSKFVSGTVPSQGLFGAKARGTIGNLDFMVVATKQENQLEKKTFQGQSSADSLLIRDYNFQENYHFFLLDSLERAQLALGQVDSAEVMPRAGTIRIWVDDRNGSNNTEGTENSGGAIEAQAWVDTADSLFHAEEGFQNGFFDLQVEVRDYTLDPSNLIVDFNRAIRDDEVVAVSYVTESGDSVGSGDRGLLKLIKPPELTADSYSWDNQLRNQYYLGSTNIIESSLEVEIYKGDDNFPVTDEEIDGVKRTYLNIFGLDENSDGKVELSHVDFERGLLIFPSLKPFSRPLEPDGTPIPLEEPNEAMYVDDNPVNVGLQNNIYTIRTTYRSRTTSFNLGVLNVMEGSERVTVNGRTLSRGVDYEMIYEIGQIIFFNPDILADDAEVKVDYEFAPLFAQSQITMVGLRGDYRARENAKISTTWLVQSESSIEQRPRLGDESKRMVVGEVDGSINMKPPVMTALANAMPLVETDAESKLDIVGEVALSLPNPNTRGEVFVDDFEGSSLIDSYSMARRAWQLSSPPEGGALDPSEGGGLTWFNPTQGAVIESDLNPNVPPEEANRPRTVLALRFAPGGTAFREDSWRSVVQSLSNSGLDFSQKKFMNVWINGWGGEVWLDLGTVSEDALRIDAAGNVVSPNDELDTEDLNRDGKLDFDEDIGVDGVAGLDGAGETGDDGNDDYDYAQGSSDFTKINGTENNKVLDTEDLNGNNTLETDEKVFRYRIDLDAPDPRIRIISENPSTGWKLYQIPIQDDSLYTTFGNPDLRRIKHLRVTMTGFDADTAMVMIGSIEVEGNSWLERGVRNAEGDSVISISEKFAISVKNTSDNGDYFSPPGVSAQQDQLGVPSALQTVKEQSLNLIYDGLEAGHMGLAVQPLLTPQNYIDYRSMSVWVRRNGGSGEPPAFFLEVGTDSLNYYQYTVTPGTAWEEVVIPFQDLTDVKKEALDALPAGARPSEIDFVRGPVRVRGNPTITNVRRLALGVENRGSAPVSGEIWVDELRLTGVIRDRGVAQRLTIDAGFADLGGVRLDYVGQGDQFRQLNQKRRNLQSQDVNFSTNLRLDKLAPAPLGLDIPFTWTRRHGRDLPLYRTGSDILFDEGLEREEERTESITNRYALKFAKKKASPNRFIRATVDKITGNFSATDTWSRSPVTRNINRNETVQANYSTPFEGDYDLPIFPSSLFGFLKRIPLPGLIRESAFAEGLRTSRFRYMPGNFRMMGKVERLNQLRINSVSGVETPYRNLYSTGEMSVSHRPLRSLSGSYRLRVQRDLDQRRVQDVLGVLSVNVGTEIRRNQNFKYTWSPEIVSWLSPSWTYDTTYDEDHRPEVSRSLGDSLDVRSFTSRAGRDLSINLGMPALFRALAGSGPAAPEARARVGGRKRTEPEEGPAEVKRESRWTRGLRRASTIVRNATLRLGREKLTDYDFVEISPPLLYQFGFRELDLPPRERRFSRTMSIDGGFNFPAGISVTTGYRERNSDNEFRGSSRFSSGITWPDIGVDVSNLRLPANWRRVLTSLSVNSRFTRSRDVNGTESNGVESLKRGVDWSPFLSLSGQMRNGLSLSYNLNKSETTTLNFTGSGNTNVKESNNHQFNLNYSLRSSKGLGLPVPGLSNRKLKLKSDLRFQLALSRGATREIVFREGTGETEIANIVTTTFAPSADYDFSRITTGLRFNYTAVDNRKSDQKRITIGANVWMEFLF